MIFLCFFLLFYIKFSNQNLQNIYIKAIKCENIETQLTNSMSYVTQRFNATFTRALQSSLSWAESIQCLILIPISLRSILILSSHLRTVTIINIENNHMRINILKEIQIMRAEKSADLLHDVINRKINTSTRYYSQMTEFKQWSGKWAVNYISSWAF